MGKNSIKKDIKKRKFVVKNEFKLIMLKYQLSSNKLNKKIKLLFHYKFLKNFHLDSSKTRLVNLCRETGRSHWILREFKLSRMSFRKFADQGLFNGVRRASW